MEEVVAMWQKTNEIILFIKQEPWVLNKKSEGEGGHLTQKGVLILGWRFLRLHHNKIQPLPQDTQSKFNTQYLF